MNYYFGTRELNQDMIMKSQFEYGGLAVGGDVKDSRGHWTLLSLVVLLGACFGLVLLAVSDWIR